MVTSAVRRTTQRVLRTAALAVVDTLYPPRCAACRRRGTWVCADCDRALPRFAPPWCARCGRPEDGRPCECDGWPAAVTTLRSVAAHDGWLRQAIIAFKYDDEWARADHLAIVLADVVRAVDADAIDALVPVPLHPERLRRRGYNQSALLADRVGAIVGTPVVAALRRVRPTPRQVGLSDIERRSNVAGAFAPETVRVEGLRLLLIDDVVTTGSTIAACAETLEAAGAVDVRAASLTRQRGPGLDRA